MITVIDIPNTTQSRTPDGHAQHILGPHAGTRAEVAVRVVNPNQPCHLARSNRTQVAYLLDGDGATVRHTTGGGTVEHQAPRRSGVYLEPGEAATIVAAATPLQLLIVTVPKHTGRDAGSAEAAGYFFEESGLRSLIDEKNFRERTFWVNKETGLSGSWDLQLGRMRYAPHAHSPRHVHHPSKTSPVTPEHFYLIEEGTGEVKHDTGSLPVGPGSLVLIPAGEWHQLVASATGFDYIEFQAPFDFKTTMDADPLGKNWYIKGTDDGTGKPKLWVQS